MGQSFSSNQYTRAKDFPKKLLNGNEAFYDKVTNQLNCFQSKSEEYTVPEIWRRIDNPSLNVEVSAADRWLLVPIFISVKPSELKQVLIFFHFIA